MVVERDEAEARADGTGDQGYSRRGVLTGAVLGAAAIMLASCQGGEDEEEEREDD